MSEETKNLELTREDFAPADENEKMYMVKMRPQTTAFKDGIRRLKKNKVAMVSFWVIVIITLAALLIPMVWPYKYEAMLGMTPGKPVDASFQNLTPMSYSTTELSSLTEVLIPSDIMSITILPRCFKDGPNLNWTTSVR